MAMNKIVRENYPVSKLPEDLRSGIAPDATATVIITFNEERPDPVMTLDEIFALRQSPFRTANEIDAEIRRAREEWDG
jgi:hypothetical protein